MRVLINVSLHPILQFISFTLLSKSQWYVDHLLSVLQARRKGGCIHQDDPGCTTKTWTSRCTTKFKTWTHNCGLLSALSPTYLEIWHVLVSKNRSPHSQFESHPSTKSILLYIMTSVTLILGFCHQKLKHLRFFHWSPYIQVGMSLVEHFWKYCTKKFNFLYIMTCCNIDI